MSEEILWWGVTAALILAIVLVIVWRQAVRLDRLHRSVLRARATLDALLVRRANAALALAASGMLDPASSALIYRAATDALEAGPQLTTDRMEQEHPYTLADSALTESSTPRASAESTLTQVLRATLPPAVTKELDATPPGRELLRALTRANQQVMYARRFHNDHVARCRQLRSHLFVKVFCLAGHAALPDAVDIDDALTE